MYIWKKHLKANKIRYISEVEDMQGERGEADETSEEEAEVWGCYDWKNHF